jgi:hypothetical protein
MSDNLVKRLEDPPFGTETSERNLMAQAAAALVAKDAEIARLRGFINDLIDAAENDRRRAQHKGETP